MDTQNFCHMLEAVSITCSIQGPSFLLGIYSFQLRVSCWFGAWWFGIRIGAPKPPISHYFAAHRSRVTRVTQPFFHMKGCFPQQNPWTYVQLRLADRSISGVVDSIRVFLVDSKAEHPFWGLGGVLRTYASWSQALVVCFTVLLKAEDLWRPGNVWMMNP